MMIVISLVGIKHPEDRTNSKSECPNGYNNENNMCIY